VTLRKLRAEYNAIRPLADRFAEIMREQLTYLLVDHRILLSFPVQTRVKEWKSIAEKIERLSLSLSAIRDLIDLIGLRLVLPFKRDIHKVCQLIPLHFTVHKQYDTQERLKEDQFAYSSIHFIIELPEPWLIVPTLKNLGGLRAEVQVRTTSQHVWAEASHIFQYKREKSVPRQIRRAIHRVSALLETVDHQFEEILKQGEAYQNGTRKDLQEHHNQGEKDAASGVYHSSATVPLSEGIVYGSDLVDKMGEGNEAYDKGWDGAEHNEAGKERIWDREKGTIDNLKNDSGIFRAGWSGRFNESNQAREGLSDMETYYKLRMEKLQEEENDPQAIKLIMDCFDADEQTAKEAWQHFIEILK
jgi:ppGpp synthetase/RelA/SpoT-type nucleotidyltranferase